jgi:DNA-directed RNA polymerase subunit beta'
MVLEDGWDASLTDGDQVTKDKTAIAENVGGEKRYSSIDGTFFLDGRTIYVRNEREERDEYSVPITYQVYVEEGEIVTPGQQLTDGARDPQQILLTRGREDVQRYIIDEVQKVYRSQGVNTNDKHIEVICRQMLRKVSIVYPGDTDFLQDERIDRFEFNQINEELLAQGGEPATAMPVLLGITKASLETDSFLAAASFQETTRVLTEAAVNGKVDHLRGLKENVIICKLIPAGSGVAGRAGILPTSAADEAALAAMTDGGGVATLDEEQASDEDLRELMESGFLPGQPGGESGQDGELEGFSEWDGSSEGAEIPDGESGAE